MKLFRTGVISLALMLLLSWPLTVLAAAGGAGDSQYSNTALLTDNLSYTNTIYQLAGAGRVESFMLALEPRGSVRPIILSCDTVYGGMTVDTLVEYAESQGYNVLAAVNSDFFGGNGVPFGPVVEDGVYKSSAEGRSIIGFDQDGQAFIRESSDIILELENQENGASFAITHFNKNRYNQYGLYLYSSAFSTVSTRTGTEGWMVRLRILKGDLTLGGQMKLEVAELISGKEAVPIGDDYLILTADATSNLEHVFQSFAQGDRVTLNITCDDDQLQEAAWACGAGDILAEKGRLTDSSGWDSLINGRHPRTAAGIRADGSLVLYVADGRQSGHSAGLTMAEVGEELLAQDCETVVNLDGGASSAMSLRLPGTSSAQVVNIPAGGQHRCATYILLVTDERANGRAQRVFLKEDGSLVLAGSTIALSFAAMDQAYLPVDPGYVLADSGGLGQISGNWYQAGLKAGVDTVSLNNGAATGSGFLHITTEISGLSVSLSGSSQPLAKLRLKAGESAALSASATYLGREVLCSAQAFSYNVLGEVGLVTPEGVFTAGAVPGAKGALVVSGYGVNTSVEVSVLADFQDIKNHWAESQINALAAAGVVTGVTGTAYAPAQQIRRGDFILMLYRAAGEPVLSSFGNFSDVDPDRYYSNAIIWAGSQGIAKGDEQGRFRPDANLSREEAMTFVWRAMKAAGKAGAEPTAEEAEALLSQFSDIGYLAEYARIPAAALVKANIISGDAGRLGPAAYLTRAEMAKILCLAWGIE